MHVHSILRSWGPRRRQQYCCLEIHTFLSISHASAETSFSHPITFAQRTFLVDAGSQGACLALSGSLEGFLAQGPAIGIMSGWQSPRLLIVCVALLGECCLLSTCMAL